MNRKAIAIITALAAINVISTSVYAVTGGITYLNYTDIQEHIHSMCQIFDIYYDVVAFEKVLEKNTENIMATYIKKMQLFQYSGKTYSDTIVENTPETIDTVEDIQKQDDSANVRKAVSIWGYGFSPEEYVILNDMYDDWRARVVIDKAMLKIKNKYSEMYRAEMEKYRVENPFLQGQNDEEVFTSMFIGDEINGNI